MSQVELAFINALHQHEPCVLLSQLFRLCRAVSSAHAQRRVKDAPANVARARYIIFGQARKQIAESLTMLGLTPLKTI